MAEPVPINSIIEWVCVPGTEGCDLRVSASATPIGHGDKKSRSDNWDSVPRENRHGRYVGKGMGQKRKREGCR
jgi:hypothetical protein